MIIDGGGDEDGDGGGGGGGEYDNDEDWEDEEGQPEEQPDASATHYPAPRLAIAASPTRANLSANLIRDPFTFSFF
ncbi:hypothetical protein FS749_009443 [Ceratobasidium sp. UAMH 11750]|nr:hypothetical protein FS749_009443 [Ceratobasidium sp. UAMH 11750]